MKYDIFTFNNELDMLDIRLDVLNDHVDKFVIIEATETFSGIPKDLNYFNNRERYKKYHDKIIHHVVWDTPKDFQDKTCNQFFLNLASNSPNVTRESLCWLKEFYQKEHIKIVLKQLSDDDICYISDIDEIWNFDLKFDIDDSKIYRYNIDYCYIEHLNLRTNEDWTFFTGPLVAKWNALKDECLNHIRSPRENKNHPKYIYMPNGGWHFNALGGIHKKVEDFKHPYYPIQEMEGRKNRTGNFIEEKNLPDILIKNKSKYRKYFLNYDLTISVIIAKYKEDTNWVADIRHKAYLYDKSETPIDGSIKLKNIGREAHTYLHHIVENYNNLSDINIFLQGNPFDHGVNLISDINNLDLKQEFLPLNGIIKRSKKTESKGLIDGFSEHHGIDLTSIEELEFTPGAQFAVTREAITKHPIEFYQKIYSTLCNTDSNPEEAHIMERLWMYMFK